VRVLHDAMTSIVKGSRGTVVKFSEGSNGNWVDVRFDGAAETWCMWHSDVRPLDLIEKIAEVEQGCDRAEVQEG